MKTNVNDLLEVNELIYLATQGNQEAFEILLETHKGIIYHWVDKTILLTGFKFRISGEIEDVLQEAKCAFAHCLYRYKPSDNFLGYLRTCIVYSTTNYIRRNGSKKGSVNYNAVPLDKKIDDEEDMYFIDLVQNNHPEFEGIYCMDPANPKVICEMIKERYDDEYEAIFNLKYEGYKIREIGIILKTTEKRVAYHTNRIKSFCAESLTKKK